MSGCVFRGIVAERIDSTKVIEGDSTLAFMDIGQVNPGQVLVVVKPHVESIYSVDDALAGAAFQTAASTHAIARLADTFMYRLFSPIAC